MEYQESKVMEKTTEARFKNNENGEENETGSKRELEAVRQRESDGVPDNVTQMRGLRGGGGDG